MTYSKDLRVVLGAGGLHADLANRESPQHLVGWWKQHKELLEGKPQGRDMDDFAVDWLVPIRDLLREAWRGDSGAVELLRQKAQKAASASVEFHRGQFRVKVVVEGLVPLLAGLFLADLDAGRIGVCASPKCPTPYFVKRRKNAKLCGHSECASETQRRWERESWARHKTEWRRSAKRRAKRQSQKSPDAHPM